MPPIPKKQSTQPATVPAKKRGKKKEPTTPTGPILYPEPSTEICVGPNAMTAARFKELLGWEEETDTTKFGSDYTFVMPSEYGGRKVRLTRNTLNRPLTLRIAETYAQEVLQRRWRYNAEPAIFGKTGQVLSCQHRGVGLVLATLQWEKHKNHWEANWPTEPTMDLLLAFGVDEDPATVNTLDTGRPRTLADVLFHSPYFAAYGAKERRDVARMTDYAIRTLWKRTGANTQDAFCPYKTHAESVDFLDRHPRILEAVRHISEENAENAISKFVSPGTAAALLYLMAASASDLDDYGNAQPAPSEKKIDFKHWDKACEFWVLFGSGNLLEVRYAIAALSNEEDSGTASLAEKIGIFALAFSAFLEHGEVKKTDLRLKYATDTDGIKKLAEHPDFGGIDVGEDPVEVESSEADDTAGLTVTSATESELTLEEIESEKARIKEEHKAKLLENREKKKREKETPAPSPVVIEH